MGDLNKNGQFLKRPIRVLLTIAGIFFVGVGIIGIVVPVLPTTPFLLISAALFARSSQRFYEWLINNKIFGRYFKNYREGKGIPLKIKIPAITLLWVAIGFSTIFAIHTSWLRILLVIIAVGATIHIVMIRPKKK